jgi:hypothetical protein
MGLFPPAPSGKDYEKRLERNILSSAKKEMARLGQIWLDPEMPDNWESIVAMLLLPDAKTVSEYNSAVEKVDTVAAAAASGATTPEGQAAAAGVTTDELADAQTWTENTADWWENTWSGDWDAGWDSWNEGFDALWNGNF